MDLWDRVLWLSIGCFFGFVLGYIVRALHEIKEQVEQVDENVCDAKMRGRNDEGFMRKPFLADMIVLVVVAITAWAAIQTGRVNAELQHTIDCITNYNSHQSKALKARDASVEVGVESEIHLWTQYGKLYALAKKDPSKIPEVQDKLNEAVAAHREALTDAQATRDAFPYAHPNVLNNCSKE